LLFGNLAALIKPSNLGFKRFALAIGTSARRHFLLAPINLMSFDPTFLENAPSPVVVIVVSSPVVVRKLHKCPNHNL
jgi:hypothetical protein